MKPIQISQLEKIIKEIHKIEKKGEFFSYDVIDYYQNKLYLYSLKERRLENVNK